MTNTKKPVNSYDDTKKMLSTIREFQKSVRPKYGLIGEQMVSQPPQDVPNPEEEEFDREDQEMDSEVFDAPTEQQPPSDDDFVQDPTIKSVPGEEEEDFAVINDVEVVIHSEDPEDLELSDEEKGMVSQLIDDFRAEVSETAEFGKLEVYETSAKLDGKIGEIGLVFTLSTGDDTGLYVNGQMMKMDDQSLLIINKLKSYQVKFSNTINNLLVRRRST